MGKYGETAVRAVQLATSTGTSPDDAWDRIARELFAGAPAAMTKSCPREAFLGVCGGGLVKGIGPEHGLSELTRPNRGYAIKAVELLVEDPTLRDGGNAMLWRRTLEATGAAVDKVHNHQMDVVLALWNSKLLNVGLL